MEALLDPTELNKRIQDAKQEVRIQIMAKLKRLISECDEYIETLIKQLKADENPNYVYTVQTYQDMGKMIWVNRVHKKAYEEMLNEINKDYLNSYTILHEFLHNNRVSFSSFCGSARIWNQNANVSS